MKQERLELTEKIIAYCKRLSKVDETQLVKEKFIFDVWKFM